MTSTKITDESLKLFLEYAKDAGNWGGEPPVWGSAQHRGNLTQLKRAKLVTTFKWEGESWIQFTEAGRALAAEHGVTF